MPAAALRDAAAHASIDAVLNAACFAAASASLARARHNDDERRRRMARTMAGLLDHVADGFDDTHGRYLLHALFLSVTTPLQRFKRVFAEQRLLSLRINLFKCDLGVVVYTIAHAQLNVNVAVPRKSGNSLALVNSFLAYLPKVPEHAGCALDMHALRSHVSFKGEAALFRPRRFVRTRDDVAQVVYDAAGRTLTLHGHTLLSEGVLHHREEVAFYKPLCRATPEDAIDVVYWHRMADGVIVLTTNPWNGSVDADFDEVLLDYFDLNVFAPMNGAAGGATSDAASGAASGATGGAASEAASEAASGATSETASGATSGAASGATSGAASGAAPWKDVAVVSEDAGATATATATTTATATATATATSSSPGAAYGVVQGRAEGKQHKAFGAVGSMLIAVFSANDGLDEAHDLCCAMLHDGRLPLLLRTEIFRHVAFTLCTLDDDLAKHGGALLHVFRVSCRAVDALCYVQECTEVLELNRDLPETSLTQALRGVVQCARAAPAASAAASARGGGLGSSRRTGLGVSEAALAMVEEATRLAEADVEAATVAAAFRRWWASSGVLSCFCMLLPLSALMRLWREEGDCIAALVDRMLLRTLQVWEPEQSQKADWLAGQELACIEVRDEIVRRTKAAEDQGEQCVVDGGGGVAASSAEIRKRAKRRGQRGCKGKHLPTMDREEKGGATATVLAAVAVASECRKSVSRASTSSSWSPRRAPRGASTVPSAPRETTYHGLVTRMAGDFGLAITLIGSGIFYRARDADVVVCVKNAASLQAAYDAVVERTGWVPTERVVTGERLVVLHGSYEGVPVDAQVHRQGEDDGGYGGSGGGCGTVSEALTRSALQVSACLEQGLDVERRAAVQVMHEWAHVAGEGGHQLCRLPGIALTCIAVVATRADSRQVVSGRTHRLRRLLEALCATLRCSAPVVDLGTQTMSDCEQPGFAQRGAAPSQVALRVLVNGGGDEDRPASVNVASRMTGATTRELLATVAAALQRPDEALLDGDEYARWRNGELVVAAYATPTDASITPRTLPSILARMEGHPCIERVWVDDAAADRMRVLVGVRADADASVYGLRAGDTWERVEDSGGRGACVHVRRASTASASACVEYRLALSPRVGEHAKVREAWDASARLSDVYAVAGTDAVIPNVPTIAHDVCAAFCGARGWRVDVV